MREIVEDTIKHFLGGVGVIFITGLTIKILFTLGVPTGTITFLLAALIFTALYWFSEK